MIHVQRWSVFLSREPASAEHIARRLEPPGLDLVSRGLVLFFWQGAHCCPAPLQIPVSASSPWDPSSSGETEVQREQCPDNTTAPSADTEQAGLRLM